MTNINVDKKYLLKEVGLKLNDEALRQKISMMGTDPEEITSDELVIEIFPNRPDMLSGYSIVRAFKQFLGKNTGLIKYTAKKPLKDYKVIVDKSVKEVRPFTSCAIIKNLKLNDLKIKEIIQLQEKLHLTFGRDRKKLAIGIYPLEKIKLPITYKALAPDKIKFLPLDANKEMTGAQILRQHPAGTKYADLLKGAKVYPIFLDANKQILSMPPIINSELTGRITEKTKEIFIECSGFDEEVLEKCLHIIVTAISDMGGEIYQMQVGNKLTPSLKTEKMNLDLKYVKKILGVDFKASEAKVALEKMGYGVKVKTNMLEVEIPCYRADILGKIDLVEDLAIGYGYENFKPTIPKVASTAKELDINVFERKLRKLLSGFGLLEIKNYEIINSVLQTKLIDNKEKPVMLLSSVSSEYNSMRTSLAGSMLNTLKFNLKNEQEAALFEIGTTFHHDKKQETNIREEEKLGIIISNKHSNFTTVKRILTTLMKELDLKFNLKEILDTLFIEGRAGTIFVNKKSLGRIGEISPQILLNLELKNPCAYIEIDLDKLL
jgi:phenylalanyl-tRNA synthetase beta chain